MARTVAVTGATGFIGSHVVGHLGRAGWRVRILTRRVPTNAQFADVTVEAVIGTLEDGRAVARLVRGADAIVHAAGRIKARIKPNIVFTETITGNPVAEVEVSLAPDGRILGRKLLKGGSGIKEWDEAVQRAIDRTEVLPRDIDGRVPSTMIISFRPRD